MGPLLIIWRRWRSPFGTATLLLTTVSTLVFVLSSEASPALLVAPLIAGIAADLAVSRLGFVAIDRWWPYALAGGVALVLWVTHFAAIALTHGLRWTPELWGGAIVLAVLAAVGMAVLAFPPTSPLRSEQQGHDSHHAVAGTRP